MTSRLGIQTRLTKASLRSERNYAKKKKSIIQRTFLGIHGLRTRSVI